MEKEIWKGAPSQWTNFNFYALCVLMTLIFGLGLLRAPAQWANFNFYALITLFFGLGLVLALWKYFDTKLNVFTITDQRIIENKGILSKMTDEMELFRVKDIKHEQPFLLRLVGLSNIVLDTTDKSNPLLVINGVPNGQELKEKLREAIDIRRDVKGVRELDV